MFSYRLPKKILSESVQLKIKKKQLINFKTSRYFNLFPFFGVCLIYYLSLV